MLINEYVAMELHKRKQVEIAREAHGNRILAEIMNEFKFGLVNNKERKNNR